MADSKLSALEAATTLDNSDELYANDSGTSKKITLANLRNAINTGAISGVDDTDLTASRVVVSDGSGKIEASPVTVTELNVLDGITATTAELNYTDGVTSNIQTQIDAREAFDLVAHNADGTLKSSATAAADWVNGAPSSPTYVSGTSFTVTEDYTAVYIPGMPLKILNDGSYVYSTVESVSYSSTTTVVLDRDVLTNAAITEVLHSAIRPNWTTDSPIKQRLWQVKTANYTAVSGDRIMADTETTGAWTLTLPASPSIGDFVDIADYTGYFLTNNLTITSAAENVHGSSDDLVCDLDNLSLRLEYVDATQGWRII